MAIISQSDIVIVKSNSIFIYYKKLLKYKNKIMIIPMGFDERWLQINENIEYMEKYITANRKKGKRILIYFGAIERERKLSMLIDIIKRLKTLYPNILLLIVGGNTESQDHLIKYTKDNDCDENVLYIEKLPRSILFTIIKNTDISISPIPPTPAYIISSPTKVIESMGLGTPVVGNDEIHDQKEIINASRGGMAVKYDVEEFSNAILYLLKNPSVMKKMSKAGQEYILKHRKYSDMAIEINNSIIKMKTKL